MTYRALFDLKFNQGVSTIELEKKFPRDKHKISKLALLDLPREVLSSIVGSKKELFYLLSLKESLMSQNK